MLEFRPNQRIRVYKLPNSDEIYFANLLTIINGTLIITRPYRETEKTIFYMDRLEPNSLLYGDYEYEGKIYYFRSKVIKSSYTPFPHVILKEPDERNIKIKRIRTADRYPALTPVILKFKHQGAEVEIIDAVIIDVSINGVGIISPVDVPQFFLIEFLLNGEKINIEVEVKVFHERKFKRMHFIGAQILKINKPEIYKKYIDILKMIHERKL